MHYISLPEHQGHTDRNGAEETAMRQALLPAWAALILAAAAALAGCSSRAVYESGREYHRQQCLRLPPSEYQDCLDRDPGRYEDYQRRREEARTQ